MASIETYKRSLGAKVLKRLMVGKSVAPGDLQKAAADPDYGLIIIQSLMAEKPGDIDEWDRLIKQSLSFSEFGREKYEALAAVDPSLEINAEMPDRWGEPYTLADAYSDLPPLEYVVKGLLPVESLAIMYGAPGSMKSLLAAQIAIDVAGGYPFLEQANKPGTGYETVKQPCVWLDFDNGKRRTHERIGALGKTRGLPESDPFYYWSTPWPSFVASDKIEQAEVIERIKSREAKFVVMDNLGTITGTLDENGSQMQSVIGGLRHIVEETGAAVLVIHHSRKSSGFNGRSGDSLRGHSSIEAGIDLGLLVTREEQADKIEIKATKVRGAPVYPFAARFAFTHAEETDELQTARFFGEAIEDTQSGDAIKRAILDVVTVGTMTENNPLNQSQVIDQVKAALPKASQIKIRGLLEELVTAKKINKKDTGKNNMKIYTLPEVIKQPELDSDND